MIRYIWWLLLALEILVGLNAVVVFRFLDRPLAGMVASIVFVLAGVLIFIAFIKFSKGRRVWGRLVSGLYLFGFALPLWFSRVATPFDQSLESVLGVPLELFHRASELSYLAVFIFTAWQIWLHCRKIN